MWKRDVKELVEKIERLERQFSELYEFKREILNHLGLAEWTEPPVSGKKSLITKEESEKRVKERLEKLAGGIGGSGVEQMKYSALTGQFYNPYK